MKVFKETKETKKSWAIDLEQLLYGGGQLIAVDSNTGAYLATILYFKNGDVYNQSNLREKLNTQGYDPTEHGNDFDDDGRIIIYDDC